MDFFDEPDPNDAPPPVSTLQSHFSEDIPIEVQSATPINTMTFFDEPDPNTYPALNQHESSASPPPPSAAVTSDNTKPVDVIPEDTEKDEYRDGDSDNDNDSDNDSDGDSNSDEEEEELAKLERDLEAIKTKLDQIKIENMVFSEEMDKSGQHTSLTAEYDEKIMEYDNEFHEQQRIIEEEERLIAQYEKEFNEKIAQHNIDSSTITQNHNSDMNGIIRNAQNGGKHAQKSSIVLYDNSFAINHQLQLEIDKLTQQIEWLQTSKIQLVKNTATEVDRLRSIIKQFQGK